MKVATPHRNLKTTWPVWHIGKMSIRLDRRMWLVCTILFLLLIMISLLSLTQGDYSMPLTDVIHTLLGEGNKIEHTVIWELRLPRILVAMLVGMALALSGALLQGLTRNTLADPGIIGINQGAAVTAIALLVWFDGISIKWLPPAAFVGGAITALLIYLMAWKHGSSPIRLVLIGIGFAAFTGSLTTIMIVFSDIDRVGQAYMWLSGSVYGRSWDSVSILFIWLAVLFPVAYGFSLPMNALLQDDNTAKAIGLNIEKTRFILIMISVALASAGVASAGIFSFLGLIAPHIARLLVGATYQALLPVSALVGGVIVVSADLIGRTIIAPNQIPAGLVTAMIGAPYFFWQMKRHFRAEV